jgi:ATP synthase protein I
MTVAVDLTSHSSYTLAQICRIKQKRMVTKTLQEIVQNKAYRIVKLQLAGVIVLALIALILHGVTSGFSVLMGGLAYVLPNLIFVWRVFRYAGASQMTMFMAAFFMGEMIKLVLAAVLFLIIVKTLPVSLLSELVGFIGAIVSFWIACFWLFGFERRVG